MMVGTGLMLASPASAADTGWTVTKSGPSPASLKRTLENVAIDYRLVPGEYDKLSMTVTSGCGDGPWAMSFDLAPERASDVRETLGQLFNNAEFNCILSEGLEARMLDGFEAAWQEFSAGNHP